MLYDERWGKTTETTKAKTKKLKTKKLQPWQVILLLAADDLETNGWCQRDFADGTGSHCAIGAIQKVIRYSEVGPYEACVGSFEALARLERALKLPIAYWNDHPARTKEEVVAKLREVAAG